MSVDSGFTGFLPVAFNFVTAGVGSETVTVQTVVTFIDNSTVTDAPTSFTTSGTAAGTMSNLINMLGATCDGKIIKSIAFNIKSSIANSTATLQVNLVGLNLP